MNLVISSREVVKSPLGAYSHKMLYDHSRRAASAPAPQFSKGRGSMKGCAALAALKMSQTLWRSFPS